MKSFEETHTEQIQMQRYFVFHDLFFNIQCSYEWSDVSIDVENRLTYYVYVKCIQMKSFNKSFLNKRIFYGDFIQVIFSGKLGLISILGLNRLIAELDIFTTCAMIAVKDDWLCAILFTFTPL